MGKLIYVTALGLSGFALAYAVLEGFRAPELDLSAMEADMVADVPTAGDPGPVAAEGARDWPTLFGVAAAPAPPPPSPEPAPAEPDPPAIALRGVVLSGAERWAIVSIDGRDLLVREGEALDDGWTVAEILSDELVVGLGDRRETVAFDRSAPVRTMVVADAESGDPDATRTITAEAGSESEMRAILERVQEQRAKLGLPPMGPATE